MNTQQLDSVIGDARYRALGLIGNPFATSIAGRAPLVSLVGRAAVLRLVGALLGDEAGRPLWIRTSPSTPYTYGVFAVAELLGSLGRGSSADLLVCYVPLELFRLGRMRGTLGAVAERIAGPDVALTLASYLSTVLENIDASLPESAGVQHARVAELTALLQTDPEAAAREVFGPREEAAADVERTKELLQDNARQQLRSEPNPVEGVDASELDADDTPSGADDDDGAALDAEAVETEISSDAVFEYVIAHTRVHLSPVVARGLLAYRDHGVELMGQELKITKAPRKTLAALVTFAGYRYDHVVILHDQFESWMQSPSDIKAQIASAVLEVRWAIAPRGVVAIAMAPGTVPELEEQFAAAIPVDWGFGEAAELTTPEMMGKSPTVEASRAFIDAACWPGLSISAEVYEAVEAIRCDADSLEDYRTRACVAVAELAAK